MFHKMFHRLVKHVKRFTCFTQKFVVKLLLL